jgi:hypothetical protein
MIVSSLLETQAKTNKYLLNKCMKRKEKRSVMHEHQMEGKTEKDVVWASWSECR